MHHINQRWQAQWYKLTSIVDRHNNADALAQIIDLRLQEVSRLNASQDVIRQGFFVCLALVDTLVRLIS